MPGCDQPGMRARGTQFPSQQHNHSPPTASPVLPKGKASDLLHVQGLVVLWPPRRAQTPQLQIQVPLCRPAPRAAWGLGPLAVIGLRALHPREDRLHAAERPAVGGGGGGVQGRCRGADRAGPQRPGGAPADRLVCWRGWERTQWGVKWERLTVIGPCKGMRSHTHPSPCLRCPSRGPAPDAGGCPPSCWARCWTWRGRGPPAAGPAWG